MTTRSPILSVIIPTKNRVQYAKASIRSALLNPSCDYEVVVQENGSELELERFIQDELCDERVRYRRTETHVDVIKNFSLATEAATGEYICFIGDDDGVLPEIVDAAVWAHKQGYDALSTTRPAQYWWPDVRHRYLGDRYSGNLEIHPFSGEKSFPNPEEELRKCAHAAGQEFFNLPKVYYGLVRRSCLYRVKEIAGTCFPGPSPDLSGAIAVASCVTKHCVVDYPLVLPGSSGASTAGLGLLKKHKGRLEDWPHLPKESVENWSELVPAFFSGRTIWGEDVVQALRATGRDDVLREFNLPLLYAQCAVFHPEYLPEILKQLLPALEAQRQGKVVGVSRFLYSLLYTVGLRAKRNLSRIMQMLELDATVTMRDTPDIEKAIELLIKHLKQSNHSFQALVGSSAHA